MTDLTTRLAQADKPTRELLEEVFGACFPEPPLHQWGDVMDRVLSHDRFTAMLDAEAWTSAVEMLVPEGWRVGNFASDDPMDGKGTVHLVRMGAGYGGKVEDRRWASAATPALALAIACLKARGM